MHETASLSFLGLPFRERQLEDNCHIVSTCSMVPAMEQAETFRECFAQLESGVVGVDGTTGRKIIIIAPVAVLLGDNPRQSAFCSHRGTSCQFNCWICHRSNTHPLALRLPRRSRLHTLQAQESAERFAEQAQNPSAVASELKKFSLSPGPNLFLHMRWLDPHHDTPIELLHTCLLGIVRYCSEELFSRVPRNGSAGYLRAAAEICATMRSVDTSDCPHCLSAADFLTKKGNFVSREYRVFIQYGCFQIGRAHV